MDQIAIVVDWYGPYELQEATRHARKYYGAGLYMLIGRRKYQKTGRKLHYIGIAENLSARIKKSHSQIAKLSQECIIWLGEVASPGIPGPRNKKTDPRRDLAEWAHIYFLKIPSNTKKMKHPPNQSVTIINRWWTKNFMTPYKKRPHRDWPDIIDFVKDIDDYGTQGVKISYLRKRALY